MNKEFKVDIILVILAIISAAYGVLASLTIYFKESTAIYISLLIILIPIYFRYLGSINILRLIQNTDFFLYGFFEKYRNRNSVFKYSYDKIIEIYEEMQKGTLTISNTEISKLLEIRIREQKPSNTLFLATHIISSDIDANIWHDNKSNSYERIGSYMSLQKKIVEAKGTIKRIFIIHPGWCSGNPKDLELKVKELEKSYNSFFKNSKNAEARFVNFKTARLHELVDTELTFINRKEVFEWILNPHDKEINLFTKGIYHCKNKMVENLQYSWDNLYDNSVQANDFKAII